MDERTQFYKVLTLTIFLQTCCCMTLLCHFYFISNFSVWSPVTTFKRKGHQLRCHARLGTLCINLLVEVAYKPLLHCVKDEISFFVLPEEPHSTIFHVEVAYGAEGDLVSIDLWWANRLPVWILFVRLLDTSEDVMARNADCLFSLPALVHPFPTLVLPRSQVRLCLLLLLAVTYAPVDAKHVVEVDFLGQFHFNFDLERRRWVFHLGAHCVKAWDLGDFGFHGRCECILWCVNSVTEKWFHRTLNWIATVEDEVHTLRPNLLVVLLVDETDRPRLYCAQVVVTLGIFRLEVLPQRQTERFSSCFKSNSPPVIVQRWLQKVGERWTFLDVI